MFQIKIEIGQKPNNKTIKRQTGRYWTNERLRLIGFIAVVALGISAITTGATKDPIVVIILAWVVQFVSSIH